MFGRVGKVLREPVRLTELEDPATSRPPDGGSHDVYVRPGETVDRLPVITDAEDAHVQFFLPHRVEQPPSVSGEILILIDQHVIEVKGNLSRLQKVGCSVDHLREVGQRQPLEFAKRGAKITRNSASRGSVSSWNAGQLTRSSENVHEQGRTDIAVRTSCCNPSVLRLRQLCRASPVCLYGMAC